MPRLATLEQLNLRIVQCRKCPRLRTHCQRMAQEKRASFRQETYFGRPIPNFGDPHARILVVGLAPAAHGANRTGRMFTGDRSGDFLYRAMHEVGLANQPTARHIHDGLALHGVLITASCHCAPPENKPTPEELENCAPFLDATFDLLPQIRVVLVLGKIAFDTVLRYYRRRGWLAKTTGYAFAHAATHPVPGAPAIVCSYHPSQQNTFTGKLTAAMMQEVLAKAKTLAGL